MASVKFDAVRISGFEVNFLEATPAVTAKAAFVNTQTGATHGWTTGKRWSNETMDALRILRDHMERDLADQHFEGGGNTSSATISSGSPRDGFQGLGEHLGTSADPVPQG